MQLSERKKLILNSIVNEYVETAEPVGSAAIAKKYEVGCSAATIRNEMAELDEMGFLDKPHTSAGRIPSGRGYRFYVNSMTPYIMDKKEKLALKRAFSKKLQEMNNFVAVAADFIARMTNYTVIASDCFEENPLKCVYTDGVGNIFNHPEYKNLEKAKRLITFMDNRDRLYKVISGIEGESLMRITIGEENGFEDLKDCSVVVSRYYDKDGKCGGIGIIGPTRMYYPKVVASLGTIAEMMHILIEEKER